MYDAIKSTAISEAEAIKLVGAEAVEKVKSEICDFTNRVIDDCYGVVEMSASIKIDPDEHGDRTLVIYYLIDNDDLDNADGDLGNLNYDNYTFEII
jgi:hypothetical protein